MQSAVDTNVLVRFLVDDGSGQVETARRVFDAGRVFVPMSVMLESEWVLRSSFAIDRKTICEAFARVLNMPSVAVEQADVVLRATEAHRKGIDFADALHLFSAEECDAFYSFDNDLRRRVSRLAGPITVLSPAKAPAKR